MFSSHHAVGNGSALDGAACLSRSSAGASQDHFSDIEQAGAHDVADSKRDSSFHIFDGLGLFENHSESGGSSLHYGTMIGTPDTGQSSVSVRDDGDRQSTPKAAPHLKMEVDMDHQSQLPTPLHDFEAPFSSVDKLQHDRVSYAVGANGRISPMPSQQFQPSLLPTSQGDLHTVSGVSQTPDEILSQSHSTPSSRTRHHASPEIGKSERRGSQHTPGSARKIETEFRARSSIPSNLTAAEFARQSFLAAYSSRLNPSALHPGEYRLLKDHLTLPQVSIYLNIRNAILRIWTRNPLVSVREDEAAGCARDGRYFSLALLARQWLIRHGYINFGCVDIPSTSGSVPRHKAKSGKRSTIVVIGAGMSGLGCARQLEGLIASSAHQWTDRGERPPRVVVLEGRNRLGGRIYSHQLRGPPSLALPPGLRSTAEMGAQIVTGFEHGNPMNIIIRGQLGIHTYALKDNSILYDHDGSVVGKERDVRVENLYNDILERASVFRNIAQPPRTVEVDRQLLAQGKELPDEEAGTITQLEDDGKLDTETALQDQMKNHAPKQAAVSTEKLTGRAYQMAGLTSRIPAAEAAREMGWTLTGAHSDHASISLSPEAAAGTPGTLGHTMDDGITQYQRLIPLTPQDMRLYNWHHANLEYANSANVNQLSLTGWDQDLGNEFEGEHTEVIGGYSQVPRGLWQSPYPLDIRYRKKVTSIKSGAGSSQALVACADGESFDADHVVLTAPLGVLKAGTIHFSPPLPEWKTGAVQRLGFGLLNKVVLVYERAFWEESRDMFGLLNDTNPEGSLNQRDYSSSRGRFYLFWNIIKTSGRPTLVALMAGDAAYQTEQESNESLVEEATSRLKKMFPAEQVPPPSEAIVTRWLKDPFSCGSYSFVGPHTQSGDYDVMAQRCGNIHFAGEATCGTHPATVHGAYLSGLRAAAEVVDELLGPVAVPQPLFPPRVKVDDTPAKKAPKRKYEYTQELYIPLLDQKPIIDIPGKVEAEAYEASIIGDILRQLGDRPVKPAKQGVNPFLLFQKDYWYACKAEADAAAQKKSRKADVKASKQEIRSMLGNKWRTAPEEVRKPYLDAAQASKDGVAALTSDFKDKVTSWDEEAAKIRQEFVSNNPPPAGAERYLSGRTAIEFGKTRKEKQVNGEDHAEGGLQSVSHP